MTSKARSRLFYRDRPVFGIEISQTGLRAMALDKNKRVLGYGSVEVDPARLEESIKRSPDFLTRTIQTLLHDRLNGHTPNNHVVLSAPSAHTFTRSLSVPVSAARHLSEAVRLEAEQYIPVPIDELSIDYQIIGKNGGTLDVLMCAIPERIAETIVRAAEDARLVPVLAEPALSSIARLVQATEHGDLPTVLVDIGAASTDLAVLNKAIRVTGSLGVGGNTMTLAIAKHMKLSLEEAFHTKKHDGLNAGPRQDKIRSAVAPHLDLMIAEIRKVIRYYAERIGQTARIEQVVIVGGGSYMPGLGDYITEALLLPARVANPWHLLDFGKLKPPPRQLRPRYLTVTGLAMIDIREIWQ